MWKVPRRNKTRSYVTPIIREIDGRTQMILSGSLHVASYDPRDGSLHWTIEGPTEQFVASLVYNGELLFLTAGFPEITIFWRSAPTVTVTLPIRISSGGPRVVPPTCPHRSSKDRISWWRQTTVS